MSTTPGSDLPASGAAAPVFGAPPSLPAQKTSGMAVAALVLGILSVLGFFALIIPTVLAIVFGHVAYAKIKAAPQSLKGQGMAMAGFILGYLSIALVPVVGLLAAMAIPAFNKVREHSLHKVMLNDARQLGAAAQQHFLETGATEVEFGVDAGTGQIQGPLSTYVRQVTVGTHAVDGVIELSGGFSLANEKMAKGEPFVFDAEGGQVGGPRPRVSSTR